VECRVGIESGPALQQAGALTPELRRALTELRRTLPKLPLGWHPNLSYAALEFFKLLYNFLDKEDEQVYEKLWML
jgi:hypothetical protein